MKTITEVIPSYQETEYITTLEPLRTLPLAELYANFIKATGQRSKNTARAYGHSVCIFLEWLGKRQGFALAASFQDGKKTVWQVAGYTTPLKEVDLATLDNFALYLAAQGNAQTTINNRLAAVNSFLSVALRDKAITRDQGIDLNIQPYKPKQKRTRTITGRRLDINEVKALRGAVELRARTDNKAARDRAIIDLMLFAGLRRDEVSQLAVSDIKQDGGRYWLIVNGKGNQPRRVKVHDTLYKSLVGWLAITGRELGNGCSGPIFYNLLKDGTLTENQLNPSVVGRIVAEYGYLAGLAPLKSPKDENGKSVRGVILGAHDLRRTCARNARDNGAALEKIQVLLGHSDVKTTQLYIGDYTDDDDTATDYIKYL